MIEKKELDQIHSTFLAAQIIINTRKPKRENSFVLKSDVAKRFAISQLPFDEFIRAEIDRMTPFADIRDAIYEMASYLYWDNGRYPQQFSSEVKCDVNDIPIKSFIKHSQNSRCPVCQFGLIYCDGAIQFVPSPESFYKEKTYKFMDMVIHELSMIDRNGRVIEIDDSELNTEILYEGI